MNQIIKEIFISNANYYYPKGSNRSISISVYYWDLPEECSYLDTTTLDYANEVIRNLTKVVNGERYGEYEWGTQVAYVTSYKIHSEIELFSEKYYNIDTQKLLDWLTLRRDFLIYLQEKKVMIELLRVAFNNIVSDPQKYPLVHNKFKHYIEGRHTYFHDDIRITIQFDVERNEYNLTFEEFLAQIPQLVDDGNPIWVYRSN